MGNTFDGGGRIQRLQKTSLTTSSSREAEKGCPFHRVLRSEKHQEDMKGASLGSPPKTGEVKDIRKEKHNVKIKGVPISPKDILMFLQQLIQGGLMSQKELKQWLFEEVIPTLEQGDKHLQDLARLLKGAMERLGDMMGEIKQAGADIEGNGGLALEWGGKRTDSKRETVKAPVDLKNSRAFMEELIKGLRVKGKGDTSGPASKMLASEGNNSQSGQLTDSNAPVAEIAKNQLTKPHPLKDWMDSLVLPRSGQGNPERKEKATLEFSKMTQGDIRPLNIDTTLSLSSLRGGGKLESQAPPVIDQIVHAMNLSQKDGQYVVRIALKPPQLGNVDVALTVKGHQVQASFSVESPVTHGILTHQLPELRALLAQQGLTMREVSVQVGGGNPQGFRAFDGDPHKFSGNGERRGTVSGEVNEISGDLSEGVQVSHTIGGILSYPLDHINVFA